MSCKFGQVLQKQIDVRHRRRLWGAWSGLGMRLPFLGDKQKLTGRKISTHIKRCLLSSGSNLFVIDSFPVQTRAKHF
jgi:hypothetical protein